MLEQSDADVLQYEVIDDVLRDRLAELDDDTLDLAATFGLSTLKEQLALLIEPAASGRRSTSGSVETTDEPAKVGELLATWKQHLTIATPSARTVQRSPTNAPIAELLRTAWPRIEPTEARCFAKPRQRLLRIAAAA